MMSRREASLDNLDLAYFPPKIGSDTRIPVSDDAPRGAKTTLYVLEEEFGKVRSCCIVPSGNKQRVLGDSTYYCKDTIELLAILDRRG
jgi:hypothetical protein